MDRKIGIFGWYGYIQPFETRISSIKEAEFDYVMIWWEDEFYPNYINRRSLMKIVNSYELNLDNIHLPFDDVNLLWSKNNTERRRQTDIFVKWLHECKESGADTVVMHNSQGMDVKLNYGEGFASFNEIINAAEDIKLRIAFENTRMFEYTEFVLNEFKSDYVGFCYDSSHDFIKGQSFGEILKRWKSKLFAVHLSDNDGTFDYHWISGNGHVDWEQIIGIIKETDIKSFSMETYPFNTEKSMEPLDFLVKARDSLKLIIN